MSSDVVVRTPAGRVRGTRGGAAALFRGIPYAVAPHGSARFAAPVPRPAWDGIRDATGPVATAPAPRRSFGPLDLEPVLGTPNPGADHLTISVTTPDPGAGGLPVLVFLHGGGFVAGSPAARVLDGVGFARAGIVLVNVGYRVGIPGWLDVPGAPANRGLLDVLVALRHVQESVAAFGGDPSRVTVAGQSAGAMIVACLLATPAADGLFQRAISQSGGGRCAVPASYAADAARAVADRLGIEAHADEFGRLDDETLADVAGGAPRPDPVAHGFLDVSLGGTPFKPVLDGELLDRQPADAVGTGRAAGLDLLAGTNDDEANLYLVPRGRDRDDDADALRAAAVGRVPDPDTTLDGLRRRYPGRTAGQQQSRLVTEAFAGSTRDLLDAHAGHPGRTHGYLFDWPSGACGGRLGAAHCVELPFVFGRADLPALRGDAGLLGADGAPPGLAARVHSAWASFVASGDAGWPAHTAGSPPFRLGGL